MESLPFNPGLQCETNQHYLAKGPLWIFIIRGKPVLGQDPIGFPPRMQSPSPELSFNSSGILHRPLPFYWLGGEEGPRHALNGLFHMENKKGHVFFFSKLFLMLPNTEHSARV